MLRISTLGKDDSGSILLDVIVSLVLITLTLFPLYSAFQNLNKVEKKQEIVLGEVLQSLNDQGSWYFIKTDNEE